jgi:hypothetical protein
MNGWKWVLLCFSALLTPLAARAADAPPWLRQAVQSPVPQLDRNVPAIVLLNEKRITIEDDGKIVTSTSHAVRILTRSGRSAAIGGDVYRTDSGKVRDLKAWLIPSPAGAVRQYDKDDIVDVAMVNNDVYNEVRMKRIAAVDAADAGSIFGYESTSEERAVFTQFEFQFQQRLPVLVSRFALTVPPSWRVASVTFNHNQIPPAVNGSTYSWELRDLPGVEDEPASPQLTSLVARLAVSTFPPADSKASSARGFSSWQDVSRWLTELNDPQVIINDALAAKARLLTTSASTDYDRIAAIGKFIQGIQYISIQTGIGRGGGYRPHTSVDVLNKGYGDCKDKANLMRAMLKAIGVTAYPVAIYSGNPDYVREEWPSPQQFNHAIVAIPFNQDIRLSSALNHPILGRLLIFDPTDTETPVGELPDHEQGSFALIVAGDRGGLARMPVTAPESNRLERSVDADLEANGALKARVRERFMGEAGVDARRELHGSTRSEYDRRIEAWVVRSVSGANVSRIELTEDDNGPFTLETEFSAAQYGQLMQNRLLIFKPAIVSRRASLFLTEPNRHHPVLLSSQAYTETVRIKLPDGFQIDEVPEPLKIEEPFGSYSASHALQGGFLIFTRSLTIRRSTLPVEQYSSVRSFYQKVLALEQSPAVLVRK